MISIDRDKEILHMQIRLFRMACTKWQKSTGECADIFDKYDVDAYIRDGYEIFHVQGDEANMDEISGYIRSQGGVSL